MGVDRLELSTFRLSSECSNQLSYTPLIAKEHGQIADRAAALLRGRVEVDATGVEPAASCLQSRRSPIELRALEGAAPANRPESGLPVADHI